VVDAVLLGPREDNSHGCDSSGAPASSSHNAEVPTEDLVPSLVPEGATQSNVKSIDETTCKNRCTHVVHRGGCTFVSKAVNMEKLWDAAAVIVINTMDELFLMSADGPDGDAGLAPNEMPLSVLVTRHDGDTLLEILREEADEYSAIFARISLERHVAAINSDGTIVNADGETSPDLIYWPVIRGNGNSLQILAEFGWGIQAVQNSNQEWQLQLLKHGDAVRSE